MQERPLTHLEGHKVSFQKEDPLEKTVVKQSGGEGAFQVVGPAFAKAERCDKHGTLREV